MPKSGRDLVSSPAETRKIPQGPGMLELLASSCAATRKMPRRLFMRPRGEMPPAELAALAELDMPWLDTNYILLMMKIPALTMGIMVYSLLWVMQDLYHQP